MLAPLARHVAVGLVGPDKTLLGLDPLELSGLDHAEMILGLDPLERWPACCWGPCWPGRDVTGSGSVRAFGFWPMLTRPVRGAG